MKKKINNRLIAEACRASLNRLIKETEEFNNHQISIGTLIQCMFQAIEEYGFYSDEASVNDKTIYIDYNTEYGCQLGTEYDGDLGHFEFNFDVSYDIIVDYYSGGGDGYWEPIEYPSCDLVDVKQIEITPIKVSGDIETEIPINSELSKKIVEILKFELDSDYAERLVEDWMDYNPWED